MFSSAEGSHLWCFIESVNPNFKDFIYLVKCCTAVHAIANCYKMNLCGFGETELIIQIRDRELAKLL